MASRVPFSILPKFISLTQRSRGSGGDGSSLLVLDPHPLSLDPHALHPTPTVVPCNRVPEISKNGLLP